MEKPIVGVVSLAIGTGLGFLLAKVPHDGDANSGPRGTGASVATVGESLTAGGATGTSSKSGRGPEAGGGLQNVDALLALVDPFNPLNPGNNRELYEKIDQLDLAGIAALAEKMDSVPVNDNRAYQVSSALFARWAELDPDAAWDAATKLENSATKGPAMSSVLAEIARTDFSAARRLVEGLKNGQEKLTVMNGMIATGTSHSPELVFDMVSQVPGQQAGWQFHQLFQQWVRDQPEAAIAKLSKIQGQQQRTQAIHGIVAGLAATDPDRAIALARGLQSVNERTQALNIAAANIATTDPQRALQMLDDVTAGNQRQQMIGSIASSWASKDASAAVEWIQSLPPGDRKAAMNNSIWQIAQNDPKLAAGIVASLPMSNNLFQNVASQWAWQDSDAAAAWVETLPKGTGRREAVNGLVNSWQNDNPAKAAALLAKEGITNNNSYMAGNVFGNWVTSDREAAVAWIDGLELGRDAMDNAVSSAIRQWAQNDSSGAAEYALGIADEKVRTQAVSSLMGSWGQSDPTAAKDWALANLEGDIKTESLTTLIQNLAHNDHTLSLELYAEISAKLTDEEVNKSFGNVASSIAGSWSQHDAPGAAEWVMGLPAGDQRSNSVNSVVRSWSEADPVAASEFVGTLAKGSERDGAVESLVRNVQQSDPESAFIWAESISDEQRRNDVVSNAAMQWKEVDSDGAFRAVGNANIPDEQKVQLLKRMQE
ncbi:MAG: hypothetical protein O3C21_14605 [Verrucomicrobia bacterium]|nr:hypothetical protein [Verrucomicrobiota bacterium]